LEVSGLILETCETGASGSPASGSTPPTIHCLVPPPGKIGALVDIVVTLGENGLARGSERAVRIRVDPCRLPIVPQTTSHEETGTTL